MGNVTEEKWIEMLEKKADGNYVAKYPKVKSKSGVTFDEHVAEKTNPHNVTKAQIGLGNVQNYGIATQSEAEAGTSNAKYMTPLRVKAAITALGGLTASGSYIGNGGTSGGSNNYRPIIVGFAPKLVIITNTTSASKIIQHILTSTLEENVCHISEGTHKLSKSYLTDNGFMAVGWDVTGGADEMTNATGDKYSWVAIG